MGRQTRLRLPVARPAVLPIVAAVLLSLLTVGLLLPMGGTASASTHHGSSVRSDVLGCNNDDPPTPASPGGSGSFAARMQKEGQQPASTVEPGKVDPKADPFLNPKQVSLESVYGPVPQWITYDNGCTGQFVAGAGTSLGNIMLTVSGLLPNWSHLLLRTVVDPHSPLKALNEPIASATKAVSSGVWSPWLPIAILLVGATAIWRARRGQVAGSVTAAAWALGVLVVVSWAIQYPVQSVELVDQGVSGATEMIAAGFDHDGTEQTSGTDALDARMDDVIRDTQYRTWLSGTFGDPDSKTAHTYGPRLFRATHFSWDEYDLYKKDPGGKGSDILKAKQADFKTVVEQIKDSDPAAYDYLRGGHWSQRVTIAIINLLVAVVTSAYLLLAGLAALLGFVLIRLIVPFTPAAGVLFMMDRTRDMAVGLLKRVVAPLVMGPICFLVALILLRFESEILRSPIWYLLKLALIGALAVVAWWLTRPAAYGVPIPGLHRVRPFLTALATRQGSADGVEAGLERRDVPPANRQSGAGSGPPTVFIPGYADRPLTAYSRSEAPALPAAPERPEVIAGSVAAPVPALSGPSTSTAGKPQYGWSIGPHKRISATDKYPPPPVTQTIVTPPLGPRTKFPPKGFTLEPHTAYVVPGRGTYYTDTDPKVEHVETDFGRKGNLNWDLNYPAPNTTYVVGDRFRYVTDDETRTVDASDVQVRRAKAPRSESIQSSVGTAAGPGYDGGHLHQNAHGGGAERINIVAQLQEMNRSGSREFGTIPNNFYQFESELRSLVEQGRNVSVDLHVRYPQDSNSRTPVRITAEFSVDGGPQQRRHFRNVRTRRSSNPGTDPTGGTDL